MYDLFQIFIEEFSCLELTFYKRPWETQLIDSFLTNRWTQMVRLFIYFDFNLNIIDL